MERTTWSPGLIGFYLSVGTASLGGAVAAVGYFLFRERPSMTLVVLGLVMMAAGLLGGIRFLRAARQER
jgi:hypothetical protein